MAQALQRAGEGAGRGVVARGAVADGRPGAGQGQVAGQRVVAAAGDGGQGRRRRHQGVGRAIDRQARGQRDRGGHPEHAAAAAVVGLDHQAGAGQSGIDGHAVVGVQGQAVGRGPGDAGIDDDVAQAAGVGAAAGGDARVADARVGGLQRDAAAGQRRLNRGGIGGIHRQVDGVQQPGAALALGRPHVYRRAVEGQLVPRRLDRAAVAPQRPAPRQQHAMHGGILAVDDHRSALAPFRRRRVDTAGRVHGDGGGVGRPHGDRAAAGALGAQRGTLQGDGAVGVQDQLAALAGEGVGLDDAGGLDDAAGDDVQRLGRQVNRAAWRPDDAAGLDLCLDRGGIDLHGRATVRRQRHGLTRRQHHRPQLRLDQALVADLRRQQDHRAVMGGDGATVDHRAGGRSPVENQPAFLEILIRDVHGRRDQAAHVHRGAAAEDHAARIDQDDRAGRLDRALDQGGVAATDAVQRHGRTVGLLEIHGGAGAHVELLPADDGLVRRLGDGHHRSGGTDARRAGLDLSPRGQHARCRRARHGRQGQRLHHRQHGGAPQQPGAQGKAERKRGAAGHYSSSAP
ncbi:Polyketide synthase [Nitrospirillum viridazoti Y2]|nr:Polyketide synthase [Nitrospirillum amazonense Y2]